MRVGTRRLGATPTPTDAAAARRVHRAADALARSLARPLPLARGGGGATSWRKAVNPLVVGKCRAKMDLKVA